MPTEWGEWMLNIEGDKDEGYNPVMLYYNQSVTGKIKAACTLKE